MVAIGKSLHMHERSSSKSNPQARHDTLMLPKPVMSEVSAQVVWGQALQCARKVGLSQIRWENQPFPPLPNATLWQYDQKPHALLEPCKASVRCISSG